MSSFKNDLQKQRFYFRTGKPAKIEFRKRQLKRMLRWVKSHEELIQDALRRDLGKSSFEAYATEIGPVKAEIKYAIRNLEKWTKTIGVKTPASLFPAKSFVRAEPYGVVLVIGAWNYPFQLCLIPLISAIAAGNCAVVKPSEFAGHTALLVEKMIMELFPPQYVWVINGGKETSEALLEEKFDYIFFTGGASIGMEVMKKAAIHLTPVTLELGGKSPCIVDETADIRLAAKRIIWGKLLNSGQTCVAPDYIWVHYKVKEKLIFYMRRYCIQMFGNNPCRNHEYPSIINDRHFKRLVRLLKEEGISDICYDRKNRKISPVIINDAEINSPFMKEEIFGPILPVMEFIDIKEVVKEINQGEKPLALYYFGNNRLQEIYVIGHVSSGSVCINDTVSHLINPNLPFGGIGNSGMGSYHGKAGFDTFSHYRSIMRNSRWLDIPFKYAPYSKKEKWLKRLM